MPRRQRRVSFTEDDVYDAVPRRGSVAVSGLLLKVVGLKKKLPSWVIPAMRAGWAPPPDWLQTEWEEVAHHVRNLLATNRVMADGDWKIRRISV